MKLLQKIPKRWKTLLISVLAITLLTEMSARMFLGLGDIPIYIEDDDFEYIYAPNQDVWRFGNHIVTNNYGMRSKPIGDSTELRILKFGDSVINGGAHVDQDDLSSTILEDTLQKQFGKQIRVLNISAGSWGVGNAYAYMQKFGDFNAKMFILVFSSHDLTDNMHHRKVVGVEPSWPSHKPICAITDGVSRYLWPRIQHLFGYNKDQYAYLKGFDNSQVNPAWLYFINYCNNKNIKLLVYLHPEKQEILNGKYDERGQRLIKLLKKNEVCYVLGINDPMAVDDYRDNIHPNKSGHHKIAESLYPYVLAHVQSKLLN